ncbi:MAG: hypothetical protein LUC88_05850 [Prevotella sp.]|nr:hypothetical protein [Prevotella sp.]
MKDKDKKSLTLKTLNKSNVWDLNENDIIRLLEAGGKDADTKDNLHHYLEIIKSAFDIEDIKSDRPEVLKKYEARGFKVGSMRIEEGAKQKVGVKKRPILRVTDLTYENIHHITAAKLMEVLDRNFGGGWDSLSQSIQDIIESGFDISTTTLPKDRIHKHGGMYDNKIADGYDVLEIEMGSWVEAIFAKVKPENEKPHVKFSTDRPSHNSEDNVDEERELSESYENTSEDEDDTFDEEKLLEESYRTTIEQNPEDLDISAEDVADEEEEY